MLITLFAISLLTRLVFLFFGHPSITHDEADFYLQGYLLAKTGSDIHGNGFFLSSGLLTTISPIPVYINALFFSILPKTVITGRLPFALLNSFMPVLAYFIVSKLTQNKKLSFMTFLVMNFSPWLTYLSAQAGYDSPLSFTFYLAAVSALFTRFNLKLKYFLFLLFSFLSFNSYMGIKASFVFLIIAALVIKSIHDKQSITFLSFVKNSGISIIITVIFITLVFISPGNQSFRNRAMDELIFLNRSRLEHTVWYERHVPKTSDLIKRVVSNKITVISDSFFDKYMRSFDARMLFVKGDPHPLYGTNYFGLFYFIEFALIFIGLYNARKILKEKTFILAPFILLLLAAPLPVGLSTISDVTIVFRAYPLIFPLSFFISMGGYYILSKLKNNFYLVSLFIYLIAFSYFVFVFQTKIKYFSSEQWHFSQKVLNKNISQIKNDYKNIYIYTNEPIENTLLYNYYNISDAESIKKSLLTNINGKYRVGNISFQNGCPAGKITEDNLYIIKRETCDVRRDMESKSIDFKLSPYIEAYDGSGTLYWQITNSEDFK